MARLKSNAGRARTSKGKHKKVQVKPRPENRLYDLVPRAGLRYPYPRTVTKRRQYDNNIMLAMAGSEGVGRRKIQSLAVQIFDIGTELIVFGDEPETPAELVAEASEANAIITETIGGALPIGPIIFLKDLYEEMISRGNKTKGEENNKEGWVCELRFGQFALFLMSLRSARLRWHLNTQHPYDVNEHCALARSIDKFNEEAERVDWAGVEMVLWLTQGRMVIDKRGEGGKGGEGSEGGEGSKGGEEGEGGKGGDIGGDSGSRDGVGDESNIEMEDADAAHHIGKEGTDINKLMEWVIKEMKALSLEVSVETLNGAFGELSLE